MTGNLKAYDSMRNYYDNNSWGFDVANRLMKNQNIRRRLENQYTIMAPISAFLIKLGPV